MALIIVGLGNTQTINQSESDSVTFLGLGTLNVTGPGSTPIDVTLTSVLGVGLLDTVNVQNANVTLGGIASVGALNAYNIGSGGRLILTSAVGVGVGTAITFTAANSHLVIGSGVNLSLLGSINGFGPGSNIDVTGLATSVSYADAAGANTGGVLTLRDGGGAIVGTIALNTGNFGANNFRLTPDGAGGTMIDFSSSVTSVTASPATADLGIGQFATLTLGLDSAVTVGGAPILTLSDGGTATYNAALSTATSLVFDHTVVAGQNTADLTVTGLLTNGGSIVDTAGNAINLGSAVANPTGILQIDGIAPRITGVTTSPGSGSLGVGQGVVITLATSEAVSVVGGSPTLTLSSGGTAVYNAGLSTPSSLVFNYTVLAGQVAGDLAVTAVNLNGAVIADPATNPIDLTNAIVNPPGILLINTTPPILTLTGVSPATASLGAGQVVAFTVGASQAVTVAGGTPTLALNDGGTAIYSAAGSTPTSLVFVYTVAAGQNTADLAITAAALNGATITNAAGAAGDLSSTVVNPAGILRIDTIAPTITGVTTSPAPGDLPLGQVVTYTLTTSEAVSVAGGVPTLALNNGGVATYNAGASTPSALSFSYTVGAGQNPADLRVAGVNLNSATVADAAGNGVVVTSAIGFPAPFFNYAITNTTTGNSYGDVGAAYTGPVADIRHQYVNITQDSLNITALVPNSFIHSGAGTDAIDVRGVGGTNVLDGGTGSNFLVGGSGRDTFFVDDRGPAADIWSTVSNFHSGAAITIYGVTPADFAFDWQNNQGAAGYTGLTLHATAAGKPTASLTLVGYNTADLSNGKLGVSFGTDAAAQTSYMYVHAT
jgi:hypothetical protein